MHCQPFTTKEAIFKAGVILIACKVWAKRGVAVCLFNMGRVGSKLFFDQVDDQLSDFGTEEKDEIFKYTTFNWKSTHISNYAVWRFMDDGKEADSVQCQINRRTLSIKMTDSGIWRHFVQCVTRSCEERMISLKILKLFLALAKSSKAPFVRDDIKLLNSQKWAVIEKEVRSENGRRRGLSGIQGAVCSVANQMKEKSGVMPTLAAAAASELGRTSGPKCVGKPKGDAVWAKVVQISGSDEEIQGTEKCADTKSKNLCQAVPSGHWLVIHNLHNFIYCWEVVQVHRRIRR
jgi:hypothetical protein